MRDRAAIPAETRLAVLERAASRCEACGGHRPLQLHHLRYVGREGSGRRSIFGHEQPHDLKALCRPCHMAAHTDERGFFWRYPALRDTL